MRVQKSRASHHAAKVADRLSQQLRSRIDMNAVDIEKLLLEGDILLNGAMEPLQKHLKKI